MKKNVLFDVWNVQKVGKREVTTRKMVCVNVTLESDWKKLKCKCECNLSERLEQGK